MRTAKKVTFRSDITNDSGQIIFHRGQVVDVDRVITRASFYGKTTGLYYPEEIIGFVLVGHPETRFLPSAFMEYSGKKLITT